jgi:hypothetical protein
LGAFESTATSTSNAFFDLRENRNKTELLQGKADFWYQLILGAYGQQKVSHPPILWHFFQLKSQKRRKKLTTRKKGRKITDSCAVSFHFNC